MGNGISLSELLLTIKEIVTESLPDRYWVRAEIASLSAKAGGHCYMELIDSNARVRANCWANIWTALSQYFLQETGSPLQVGQQVLLQVSVDFHPTYGLSLNIRNIDPAFTIGEQARQRQATIDRLEKQGMMELQQQLPLPTLVRRIAVVSAANAAGYQDFQDQLFASPYGFTTKLFPAVMQGNTAAASIMDAMNQIADSIDLFDACVIIRGGGATTDLGCFDDEELCAYCAQFPLPVFSGIGHTRDVSILDMVAYLSVKTPTAAAEWFVARMDNQAARLERLLQRLKRTATSQVTIRRQQLLHLQSLIQTLSPERVYRQGYSLSRILPEGKILRSIHDAKKGDLIEIALPDGVITARVE